MAEFISGYIRTLQREGGDCSYTVNPKDPGGGNRHGDQPQELAG